MVGGRAVDEDERRSVPGREHRDRRPVRRAHDAASARRAVVAASSRRRPPGVPDVRLALLVAAAVAERDRLEPVPLVEAACPGIDREAVRSSPAGGAPWRGPRAAGPARDRSRPGATYSCSIMSSDSAIRPTTVPSSLDGDPRLVAGHELGREPAPDVVIGMRRARSRTSLARTSARRRRCHPRRRARRGGSSIASAARRGGRRSPHRPSARRQVRGRRLVEDPRRPVRRASWAGQRVGSTSGPKMSPRIAGLAGPVHHDEDLAARPRGSPG